MAEREVKQWITVRGNHIPVFDGETTKQAVERFTKREDQVNKEQDDKDRQIKANKEQAEEKKQMSAKEFLQSDKAKKAFEYAKGKIDKESYSWKETVEDMKYEHKLSFSEARALEMRMKVYALKHGKYEKLHEEFKKNFRDQGINIDNELKMKEGLKETRKAEDLIKESSYVNSPVYKAANAKLGEAQKKLAEAEAEHSRIYNQLDQAKEKYVDPEMVKTMGKSLAKTLVFTSEHPELAELEKKDRELWKQVEEGRKERDIWEKETNKIEREASSQERKEYGRPDFKKAVGNYPGFRTAETNVPHYDDLIKKGKVEIVEMTPEQYIHECAHYIFTNSTMEKVTRGRVGDSETEEYAKMMREGTKFYTPYLNYADEQQEGLHRAVAAYMNGIEKIPVIVVGHRR